MKAPLPAAGSPPNGSVRGFFPWRLAFALGLTGLALSPLPWTTPGSPAPLAAVASFAEDGTEAEVRAEAALREGNRLVRLGRSEEAAAAYAAGWSPGGAGAAGAMLAYNLGTTAHRLGHLAEAVLWYRRAAAARLHDPWLADNLALARAQAARDGAAVLAPPGALGRLAAHAATLAWAAVGLAWTSLVFHLIALAGRSRWGRRLWPAFATTALAVWAAAAALTAWGPRPAVLLSPCAGPAGGLAAASEVWVGRPAGDERPVVGGPLDLRCPERALGLIG